MLGPKSLAPSTNSGSFIAVAMSGGVDSSVAAALLVEAGYRVIGLSMRLYDAAGTSAAVGGRCCGPRDLEDAREVAARLDIPFYVVDHAKEFASAVIDDFVSEYAAGRTPNPCVRCNEKVKFQPLIQHARALGAERLATGHYAKLVEQNGEVELHRAADPQKDQSYFLFSMPRAALAYSLFPLGDMTKEEVRALARKFNLPNSDKPDSQEICFVPDGDHSKLVAKKLGEKAPGEGNFVRLVNGSLRVVGRHEGVHRFTIGQRRGLGVAAEQPLYVTEINPSTNTVLLGERDDLLANSCDVHDVRWLGATPPASVLSADVQVRHHHEPQSAELLPITDDARSVQVRFRSPERAIAPGQAAVFYQGTRVVGGGWIGDRSATLS